MSWVSVGALAIGAVSGGAGAFLKGRAGDIQRKALTNVADTPGLDISSLTQEALTSQKANLRAAESLNREEATSRQALINDLIEQSMPGFAGLRSKAQGTAGSLLAGEIPQDVSDAVQRSAAAKSLGIGVAGSGMHRNLMARDLGTTSLGLQGQGLQWLNVLRGMTPTVAPQSAFNLAGPNANELVNIRGQERAQRMNLLTQAAGIPGQTAAMGSWLSGMGGALFSAGASGLTGGGSGGGGSGGGVPMGNLTPGYLGTSGGQYFYNIPITRG